jgi:hypothetical protein
MAKRNQDPDPSPDKAKVRIFFAEVEGNNDSIKEALKTMVQAMNRPAPVPVRVGMNGAGASLAAPAADPAEEPAEVIDEAEAEPEAEAQAAPARKRGTGPKRDYNAGIDLMPDMDFRPDGKQTLREFFAEKGPKGDMEQTLVVVYYMQHQMGMTAIGHGHVRTAFKDVNKPLPADLRSTVRNMKRQKAWLSWSTPDAMQVTTIAENYVEHDMAARKA